MPSSCVPQHFNRRCVEWERMGYIMNEMMELCLCVCFIQVEYIIRIYSAGDSYTHIKLDGVGYQICFGQPERV